MRRTAARTRQLGMSMASMAIYLTVATIVALTAAQGLRYEAQSETAGNLSAGLVQVYNGAAAYVTQYYSQLTTGQAVAGYANPDAPTIAELVAGHFLLNNFSARGYTGGTWHVAVSFQGSCPGANCNPVALVYLDRPPMSEGTAALNITALAAVKAGIPAGFSPLTNPGTLVGIGSQWNVPNPVGNQAGILAAQFSFNSSQFSAYLPRSGVLPMTGNLNMGGNDINAAKTITAQSLAVLTNGSQSVPSVTMANGSVVAFNQVPEGGVLGLIGANGQPVYLENDNGTFRLVNSNFSAQLFSVDQSGNVVAAGSVSAADLNASNTIGVGPAGGPAAVQLTSAGNVTATGTVQAGSKVVLGTAFGSAVIGDTCTPNGAIAANANGSGQLLACEAGSWAASGLPVGVVGAACSVPGGLGQDSGGTSLICEGGTWTLTQARMGSWAMMGSYYVQNGWTVPLPNCLWGSQPRILVTFGGTNTVNNSGSVNQSATNLGNGTWRVNLLDGYGNGLPGYMLAQTYCAFS